MRQFLARPRWTVVGPSTALVLSTCLVLASPMSSAGGAAGAADGTTSEVIYGAVRTDPRNEGLDFSDYRWMDLRKSRRTLTRRGDTRYLRVALWSRRDFPVPKRYISMTDFVAFHAYLDSRGDQQRDYRLFMWAYAGGDPHCTLKRLGQHPKNHVGNPHPRVNESGALSCRVPIRNLHASKHVRWRLISFNELGPGVPADDAPNNGWYP